MNSIDEVLSKLKQDVLDKGLTNCIVKLVDEDSNREVKQYKLHYLKATAYEQAQVIKSSTNELDLEQMEIDSKTRSNIKTNTADDSINGNLKTNCNTTEDEQMETESSCSNAEPNNNTTTDDDQMEIVEHSNYRSRLENSAYSPSKRRKPGSYRKEAEVEAVNETEVEAVIEEKDQVGYYVQKLKQGYEKRSFVNLDRINKQDLLELNRMLLSNTTQKIAQQIQVVISSAKSLQMLGRYFRSIVAFRLKSQYKSNFKQKFTEILQLSSKSDAATYVNLYEFVQKHYSDKISDLSVLSQLPIFTSSITWHEWRMLLTKNSIHIIEAALQRNNEYRQEIDETRT